MATSSAMNTSNQYIKYKITVKQNSQSITNNTSNVTVSVKFYRTNTGYTTWGSGTVYCKINGTKYSAAVTSSQKITESGIVLFSKTLDIKHGTDGKKELTCSAWIDHSQVTSSEQSYKTDLTTIPRKSTLSDSVGTLGVKQTLKVTRKSSSFTHTIKYTCGDASGTICTKSSDTSISFTPPISLVNQTKSRTTIALTLTITTYNGSTSLGTDTATLNCAIPSASTLTVYSGTLGVADTIGVYRENSSYTHSIKAVCGKSSFYIKADGTTSTTEVKHNECDIPFKPPIEWASQNTSGTSLTITYTTITYYGSTKIGTTTKTATCTIPETVKPSCSITVTDAMGYLDTYGAYIKGQSKFAVTVTPTLAYGSPIVSYYVRANGGTYTKASFTTGVLTSSGELSVYAEVKDQRGHSSKTSTAGSSLASTVYVDVLDYSIPQVSLVKVKRCVSLEDGTEKIDSEYAQVTFSARITPLENKNSATYTLEYKKSTDTEYTAVELTDYANYYDVIEGYYRFAAESGSSYDVRIIATDNFDEDKKPTTLSTAAVMEHWRADGKGMGFGKIGEVENGADFGWKIKANNGFINIPLAEAQDLNLVTQPNTYCGINITSCIHCPEYASGGHSFTLTVESAGTAGQLKQTLVTANEFYTCEWVRFYYSGVWHAWAQTFSYAGNSLWSGAYYMNAGQTINLSQLISKQPHGIVLIFSQYVNDAAQNYGFNSFFVPKALVSVHSGQGSAFHMTTHDFSYICTKYLYIEEKEDDDGIVRARIRGNVANETSGTRNGITYANNAYVLRYVIGI